MALGAGQSVALPFGFREVHVSPSFGPPLHFPMHGEAGDPLHPVWGGKLPAGVAAVAQIGHGCVGCPVRMVAEFSWKFQVAAPVTRSSVPLGCTGENVFVTHTERPALEIGSGVPKRQPMSVQSTPVGVEPDVVTPRVHAEPAHESVKRFVAPDGVELSGTWEMPPPIERPPQRRFLSGTVPRRSRNVLPQTPVADVDRKSKPDGPAPVVVVLDVDVDVEVVLDVDDEVVANVDVLLEVDVDVLLDVDVDVLLEVEVDVELLVDANVDVLLEVEVEVLLDVEVDVLLVLDVELLVVTDVDVLVDEDVDEVLVDVDELVLVEVEDDVELEVELEVVDEVLLDVELDVLVLDVVVVAFGLQRGSSDPNSGTAT